MREEGVRAGVKTPRITRGVWPEQLEAQNSGGGEGYVKFWTCLRCKLYI